MNVITWKMNVVTSKMNVNTWKMNIMYLGDEFQHLQVLSYTLGRLIPVPGR